MANRSRPLRFPTSSATLFPGHSNQRNPMSGFLLNTTATRKG